MLNLVVELIILVLLSLLLFSIPFFLDAIRKSRERDGSYFCSHCNNFVGMKVKGHNVLVARFVEKKIQDPENIIYH